MKLHVLAALACVLVQPLACSHEGQMQEPAYGSDTDDIQNPSESTPGSTGAANGTGGTANVSAPHTGNPATGTGVTTPSRDTSNTSDTNETSNTSGANVGGANVGGTGGTTSSGGTGASGGTRANGNAGNGGTSP